METVRQFTIEVVSACQGQKVTEGPFHDAATAGEIGSQKLGRPPGSRADHVTVLGKGRMRRGLHD